MPFMKAGKGSGKRGRPAKDPFELVPKEMQDAIAGENAEQINKRIAEIAKGMAANQELLKADPVVNDLKEKLKDATSGYRDTKKTFGQQLAFCRQALSDKGADNTGALELEPGQEVPDDG